MADSPSYQRMATLSASETLTATILNELTHPLASAAMHVASLRRMAVADDMPIDGESLSYGLERLDHAVRLCTLIISRMRSLVIDGKPVRSAVGLDTIFTAALLTIEDAPGRDRMNIEIDASWAPDPVLCDDVQIEQVVVNLVLNAIAATRGHSLPKVVLRAVSRRSLIRGRFIEVSVTDNGPGIPPGDEEVLFRPFHQAGKDGTGLGLAICRSVVEMHGGDIWYEHRQFGGASFHFTLPQARREGQKRFR